MGPELRATPLATQLAGVPGKDAGADEVCDAKIAISQGNRRDRRDRKPQTTASSLKLFLISVISVNHW
jgi:hypothetical protein